MISALVIPGTFALLVLFLREQWIRRLRYLALTDYEAYRETAHWKAVRQKALRRAGYRCQLCGGRDTRWRKIFGLFWVRKRGPAPIILVVHHNTYANVGREKPEDLVVLDQPHHGLVHDLILRRYPGSFVPRKRALGGDRERQLVAVPSENVPLGHNGQATRRGDRLVDLEDRDPGA